MSLLVILVFVALIYVFPMIKIVGRRGVSKPQQPTPVDPQLLYDEEFEDTEVNEAYEYLFEEDLDQSVPDFQPVVDNRFVDSLGVEIENSELSANDQNNIFNGPSTSQAIHDISQDSDTQVSDNLVKFDLRTAILSQMILCNPYRED